MVAPRVFSWRLKISQIWGIIKTEDLKTKLFKIWRTEDIIILSFVTIETCCLRLKIWIQHIINLKIQNLFLCAGSPTMQCYKNVNVMLVCKHQNLSQCHNRLGSERQKSLIKIFSSRCVNGGSSYRDDYEANESYFERQPLTSHHIIWRQFMHKKYINLKRGKLDWQCHKIRKCTYFCCAPIIFES